MTLDTDSYASKMEFSDEEIKNLDYFSSESPVGNVVHRSEFPQEDISCKVVNRAYLQTMRSPKYSSALYKEESDGSLKPYREVRIFEEYGYEKYAFSTKWRKFRRELPSTVGQRGPVWNACKRLSDENVSNKPALRFASTWRRFPYTASAQIWISPFDGRILKIRRLYPDERWQFSFSTIVETYSFNPAKAVVPGR